VTSTAASVRPSSRDAAGSLAGGVAIWANLASVYVIWGSTYLAIRVLVRTVPPLYGAGARFVVAGGLMLAFLGRRRALRVERRELLACALVGTLLAAGGNGLVTVAERDVPSGLAALLVASVPLWIVIYRTAGRDRVAGATLLSVAIGFAGVALLLLPGNRPTGVPLGPSLVIVGAAASWGLGSFASQRVPLPADGLATTGWQMLFGGLVLTVAGLLAGEHVGTPSGESAWAWAYLVVIGSLVAYTSYTWLLRNAPISQVATYAYVNPVVAVVLGALILNEHVGAATIAGSALIVASVAAIVRREARR
jgi:drug/metabolite transporter (DMT)-like permease